MWIDTFSYFQVKKNGFEITNGFAFLIPRELNCWYSRKQRNKYAFKTPNNKLPCRISDFKNDENWGKFNLFELEFCFRWRSILRNRNASGITCLNNAYYNTTILEKIATYGLKIVRKIHSKTCKGNLHKYIMNYHHTKRWK